LVQGSLRHRRTSCVGLEVYVAGQLELRERRMSTPTRTKCGLQIPNLGNFDSSREDLVLSLRSNTKEPASKRGV
jgi:hypothetical protein